MAALTPGQWAPARAYFPLVGLGLGGLLAGLDLAASQVLPPAVVGALLVAALLVLTRALHTEGFLDSCDGLLGGHDRESRLAILRDSHVGAFAVVGGVSLLLLKWTLLVGIPETERIGLLVLFPCLSRFAMVAAMSVSHTHDVGTRHGVSGRRRLASARLRAGDGRGCRRAVARNRRAGVAGDRDGRCPRAGTLVQAIARRDDRRHVRGDQ